MDESTQHVATVAGPCRSRLGCISLTLVLAAAPARLDAQTTTAVLLTPGGAPAPVTGTDRVALSTDGRFVAFYTLEAGLVPGDTNGVDDVFVHDRETGLNTRVSVATNGTQANGGSTRPFISGDGRYVVFESTASNLVAGDSNVARDVFLHDLQGHTTTRVSVSTGAAQGTGESFAPAISEDGRFVAFTSTAPDLVAGDTNGSSDIFVRDLVAGQTSRVSISSNGTQANGPNGAASISGDGRLVLFETGANNLVAGDTNDRADVLLHDRSTGATTRVVEGTYWGQQVLSGNGRYVAFASGSPDLVPDDTNGFADIFLLDLHDRTTTRINVTATGEQAIGAFSDSPSISTDGRFVAFLSGAPNLVPGDANGAADVFVHDRATGTTIRASVASDGAEGTIGVTGAPVVSGGGWAVAFVSTTAGLVPTDPGTDPNAFVHALDGDDDGLPLTWETAFGLDPRVATGDSGATGDPDADGRTNAEEHADGTHPRARHARYLAEGASSAFFETRLALLNLAGSNRVLLRFQKGDGTTAARVVPLEGLARETIEPAFLPGMASAEFSTMIESELPVVVDRQMRWDASGYGAHAETAVAAPSTTWYMAEGATHHGFQLFYLVQNPHPVSVAVSVLYLLPAPAPPVTKTYAVPARSRFNIWVNAEGATDPLLAGLASTDVSALLTSPQPILVERAMYLTLAGEHGLFAAGHESFGVTDPSLDWFMAEGATGPYFDEFLLIANPTFGVAEVEVRYLLVDGQALTKAYTVPPLSRYNIWVNEEEFPGIGKALAQAAASAVLTSTNGVPIIVERAMWWPRPSPFWREAHNSAGVTATGTKWGLAEGEDGGQFATETYILIANTSTYPGLARVTLVFEDGGTQSLEVSLAANSRTNVHVDANTFPGVTGKRFGALIESIGATPAQIVVERAMYSDANGAHWAAGTNAVATRLAP